MQSARDHVASYSKNERTGKTTTPQAENWKGFEPFHLSRSAHCEMIGA